MTTETIDPLADPADDLDTDPRWAGPVIALLVPVVVLASAWAGGW